MPFCLIHSRKEGRVHQLASCSTHPPWQLSLRLMSRPCRCGQRHMHVGCSPRYRRTRSGYSRCHQLMSAARVVYQPPCLHASALWQVECIGGKGRPGILQVSWYTIASSKSSVHEPCWNGRLVASGPHPRPRWASERCDGCAWQWLVARSDSPAASEPPEAMFDQCCNVEYRAIAPLRPTWCVRARASARANFL